MPLCCQALNGCGQILFDTWGWTHERGSAKALTQLDAHPELIGNDYGAHALRPHQERPVITPGSRICC